MDRLVIVRDDERVLDVESSLYILVAIDADKKEVWTRSNVQAVGGTQRAILDPLQLAARVFVAGQELKNAVKAAVKNAGLELDVDKIMLDMCGLILEREAAERSAAAQGTEAKDDAE